MLERRPPPMGTKCFNVKSHECPTIQVGALLLLLLLLFFFNIFIGV